MCEFVQLVLWEPWKGEKVSPKCEAVVLKHLGVPAAFDDLCAAPLASSTHFTQRRRRGWGWGLTEMFMWTAACRTWPWVWEFTAQGIPLPRVQLVAELQPPQGELGPGLPFFQRHLLLQRGFMDTGKSGCCVLHVLIIWVFPRLGFQSVAEVLSEFMYLCICVYTIIYLCVLNYVFVLYTVQHIFFLRGRNANRPRM